MVLENTPKRSTETSLLIEDCIRTSHENKQMDIRNMLAEDQEFRHKYVKSCWIFWAFVIYGWMIGQLGAALPDLRLIIQTDLQTASLLITGGGIGLPIGGLIIGMVYNRINADLLLAFMLLGCASMAALLPWCQTFAEMMTISVVFGIFKGGLDIGGNTAIATMWRMEGRSYMQTLHFVFSIGGIMSPFVTGLFLSDAVNAVTKNNGNALTNTTVGICNDTNDALCDFTTRLIHNHTSKPEATPDGIQIQYAYVITSVLAVSAAIPFIAMYFMDKKGGLYRVRSETQCDTTHELKHDIRKVITSSKWRRVCLIISAAVLLFYLGANSPFVNFLTTFCLEYFGWTSSASTVISSIYWFAFALGRFSGIFLIRCIKPGHLIPLFLTAMVFSISGMLIICIAKLDYMMWVFVSLVGFASSTIWASVISWVEENVTPITGKIAALVAMPATFWEMVNPIVISYLMENVSLLAFVYVALIANVICLILLAINQTIVTKHAKQCSESQ